MRLTLRTLLAYLDGILEPNDAQDLGKKIEESEYATGLVHRIRDVMRRLRLGAPSLASRSTKFDPNTVAEYLDNTLASEEVTDFEKVCLDSDVHLAEVASCHQILTLVLGEPAEIDPASRQRMYELKDSPGSVGPPPTPTVDVSADVPPALDAGQIAEDFADRKSRPRPTVPEYLREPRKRGRWAAVAAVVIVACFVGVVLVATGQFDNALVKWGGRETPALPREVAARPQETREEPAEVTEKTTAVLAPEQLTEPTEKKPTEEMPSTPAVESAKEPATEKEKQTVAVPEERPRKEPLDESEKAPAKPPATNVVLKPADAGEKAGERMLDALRSGVGQRPGKEPPVDASGTTPSSAKGDETGGAEPGAAPLPPEPLARLMSSDQVLLKDDGAGGWIRAAANQMLLPQQMLVLPTYRAKVTLTIGVTLEILGGTRLELLPSGPQELPGIQVLYGRVVMMPLAQSGSRLRVAFGDRSGVLTFSDAESVAALEVRRLHVPGTDPEAGPSQITGRLYANTGGVLWDESGIGEAKPLRLTAMQCVTFDAALTSEPAAVKELPSWIAAEPIGALDRRASTAVAQALPTDRLARLGLLELATSRPQKEVRWLALRCLGYIGQYHDMVAVLNDPARKLDWPEYIDYLREAVARDSQSAESVRMALEKQYPDQAANLYRMLWGYTDKDLQAGSDEDLVKALNDEMLAVRVLGSWNLTDVTGLGGWSYRPEQTAAKRQQAMLRWRQRLKAGEIRLKASEEKAGAAAAEDKVAPLPGP